MAKNIKTRAPITVQSLKSALPLIAVLLLALIVRLWGITWGLPSDTHYFSYHPDESRVMLVIQNLDLLHGKIMPGFYNYPSLQIYLVTLATTTAYLFGAADIVIKDFAVDHAKYAQLFLIGRLITVFMGIGTVWAAYAAGRRIWGHAAGLAAAAFLAIAPLHAQHSHWITVDVPAAFWTTLALVFAARIAFADKRVRHAALYAGLCAGLAAATKYNASLAILPIFAAIAIRYRATPSSAGLPILLTIAGAIAAFLIGCPGSIGETAIFMRDIQFETIHVSQQGGEAFAQTGSGFVYQIVTNLNCAFGLPFLIAALASAAFAIKRREPGDLLLAAFVIPYYILISLPQARYARYAIPLMPFLCIWLGRSIVVWWHAIGLSRRPVPIVATAALAAATLIYCYQAVAPMAGDDPRDRALAYVRSASLSGPTGFSTQPWFQAVPLDPYFSFTQPGGWRRFQSISTPVAAPYLYQGKSWDTAVLDARPPMIVLSDMDYRDPVRLHQAGATAWLFRLQAEYRPAFVAGGDGKTELSINQLPPDMMYTNPKTWVWVRK